MHHKFLLSIFSFLVLNISLAHGQVYGCTDPLATNYDPSATDNDGSCIYPGVSVTPVADFDLDSILSETSGLINWNNALWTHNDNSDTTIYSIDTLSGNILHQYPVNGVNNYDWEEISQDSNYIYLGDFGNNVNGNRTDLHILRIEKSNFISGSPVIDTIYFVYSDQINFTPTGSNNTDYDCEAFVVSSDSIYLFTKQWVSNATSVYVLPKIPGSHVAQLKATLNVQGMITGATYLERERLIGLCGYTNLLQPFIYLLYDFDQNDFFSGNKRKISLSLPFHQTEGIASINGLKYYLTNEAFNQSPFNTPQKLDIVDLTSYLGNYLNGLINSTNIILADRAYIYPNPVSDLFYLKIENVKYPLEYTITDLAGRVVLNNVVDTSSQAIDLSSENKGIYFLKTTKTDRYIKIIKQ